MANKDDKAHLDQYVTKSQLLELANLIFRQISQLKTQELNEEIAQIIGISAKTSTKYMNSSLQIKSQEFDEPIAQNAKGHQQTNITQKPEPTITVKPTQTKKERRQFGQIKPAHYMSKAINSMLKSLALERGLSTGIPYLQISNAVRKNMSEFEKDMFSQRYKKVINQMYDQYPTLKMDEAYEMVGEIERDQGITAEELLPSRDSIAKIFDEVLTDHAVENNQRIRAESPLGDIEPPEKPQQHKQNNQKHKMKREIVSEQEEESDGDHSYNEHKKQPVSPQLKSGKNKPQNNQVSEVKHKAAQDHQSKKKKIKYTSD